MSNSWKIMLAILLTLGIQACSSDPEPPASKVEASEQAEADHVWKEQVQTIDRAKAVEQTIKDADEAKRKAMENADGG